MLRIDEIASDLRKGKISNFSALSIAIDKSTDITGVAKLSVFAQGVTDEFEIIYDLLEVMPMKGRTRAENIFCEIIIAMNTYNLNLDKMVEFTSDAAAEMVGKKWSYIKIKNYSKIRKLSK